MANIYLHLSLDDESGPQVQEALHQLWQRSLARDLILESLQLARKLNWKAFSFSVNESASMTLAPFSQGESQPIPDEQMEDVQKWIQSHGVMLAKIGRDLQEQIFPLFLNLEALQEAGFNDLAIANQAWGQDLLLLAETRQRTRQTASIGLTPSGQLRPGMGWGRN